MERTGFDLGADPGQSLAIIVSKRHIVELDHSDTRSLPIAKTLTVAGGTMTELDRPINRPPLGAAAKARDDHW